MAALIEVRDLKTYFYTDDVNLLQPSGRVPILVGRFEKTSKKVDRRLDVLLVG